MKTIIRFRYPDGSIREQQSGVIPVIGDRISNRTGGGSSLVHDRMLSYEVRAAAHDTGHYESMYEEVTVVTIGLVEQP